MIIKRNNKETTFIAETTSDRNAIKALILKGKSPKKFDAGERILDAALELAIVMPYSQITRADIAKYAKVSPALVSHYVGDMDELRKQILRLAIEQEIYEVIAHGLTLKESIALAIPDWMKAKAAEVLK